MTHLPSMEHKDWNFLEQCAEQKQCKGSKWPDPQHLLNQNLWMIGEWFGLVVSVGGFCRQRHRQSPAWWGDARQTGKQIQLVWDNVVTPPPKKRTQSLSFIFAIGYISLFGMMWNNVLWSLLWLINRMVYSWATMGLPLQVFQGSKQCYLLL